MNNFEIFLNPFNLLFFLIACMNSLIAVYIYAKNKFGNNWHFGLLFLAITLWTFGIGMRSSLVDPLAKTLWTNIAYIGIVLTPAFFLLGVRDLFGYKKLRLSQLLFFYLFPVALITLIFTNDYHNLFWAEISATANEFNYLHRKGGLIYWANTLYQFALSFYTIAILIKSRTTPLNKMTSNMLIAGLVPPLFTTLLRTFGITPLPDYNIAPTGFLITGPILLYGINKLKIFDLTAIGEEQYISKMLQGFVIARMDGSVEKINRFAEMILDIKAGQKIDDSPIIQEARSRNGECYFSSHQFETFFHDELYYLELEISPIINDMKDTIGQLVVLNNVSEIKKIANVARVSQVTKIKAEERERIAKELQDRIAQGLYTLNLFIQSAKRSNLDGDLRKTFDSLDELNQMNEQLIKKVNLLYYELDDQAFGQIGLIKALNDQIEIQKHQSNISIDLVNFDRVTLTVADQRMIYGIIVSVLNEILKLSKPVSIVININDSSKNFMIKFMIYERNLQPGLLTSEMIELKFGDVIDSVENLNGIFEFTVVSEEQKLINVQIPRK